MGSLDQPVLVSAQEGGIATVTLNRPANFNALSSTMIGALQSALDSIAARADIRVVVLAADGRAFCAGHDLREMRANDSKAWHEALFAQCSKLMLTIESLPQPVIAQVQGIATAAGCQLVATCDLAVASDQAKFATSGINLGLFCSTPAVAVRRVMGEKFAAEMLFTGAFIDAERAASLGLVNHAVPADELVAQTRALAEQIARQSGHSVRSGKRLLRELRAATSLQQGYALAATNMACDMQSADAKAGIDAFLNKADRPAWDHR